MARRSNTGDLKGMVVSQGQPRVDEEREQGPSCNIFKGASNGVEDGVTAEKWLGQKIRVLVCVLNQEVLEHRFVC